MKIPAILLISAGLALTCSLAVAETLVVDDRVMVRESNVERPVKGSSMKAVESKFGAPAMRHATIGQPPITRWDYPGFSVFFEHEHVIHSVATAP
ncbi:MAG: hypothetical protein ABIT36_08650 [Steroidobacteraceae bacterium]